MSAPLLTGHAIAHSALRSPVETVSSEMQALNYRPQPLNAGVRIPDAVKRCMESSGERFDLLGSVQSQGQTYYLLGIYFGFAQQSPLEASDELIAIAPQQGCRRLVGIQSTAKPISVYMPQSAAAALELQRYRRAITLAGGIASFQQDLSRHIDAAKGLYLLSPEQIWALRQLGIAISSHYRVLQSTTF
ncbi:MAG TPA: hypothetical protein V6C88_01400 [Chroococcidiopsis sp.]